MAQNGESLAVRAFKSDTLCTRPLSKKQCQDLYLDIRKFFDEIPVELSEKEKRQRLVSYTSCGNKRKNDESVSRRLVVRTALIVGCTLVRESEGQVLAGKKKAFPDRLNASRYPRDYPYTILDMFLAKGFNNDRARREKGDIKELLDHMLEYHPDVESRSSRQNIRGDEDIRVYHKRLVYFVAGPFHNIVYSSTARKDDIPEVCKVLLANLMYSKVRGYGPHNLLPLNGDSMMPANKGPIPRLTSESYHSISQVPDVCKESQEEWMRAWKSALSVLSDECTCSICHQVKAPFQLGNLPFNICQPCFGEKENLLRQYICNDCNKKDGKFDFEDLLNTIFPRE